MMNLFFRVYAVFYWDDIVKKKILLKVGDWEKKDIKEGEDQLRGVYGDIKPSAYYRLHQFLLK